MRRDAARNRETILSSAIGVLAGSPDASMREIAEASQTGRTTLYRHFPDRDALVRAIYERVDEEAEALAARALERPGPPVDVLAALSVELAGLGDQYRFLERSPQVDAPEPRGEPLRAYLAAAQARGEIRGDVTVAWLFDVLVALITFAASARPPRHEDWQAQLEATISSLLRAEAATPRSSPARP